MKNIIVYFFVLVTIQFASVFANECSFIQELSTESTTWGDLNHLKACKYIKTLEERISSLETFAVQQSQKKETIIKDEKPSTNENQLVIPRKQRTYGKYLGCFQDAYGHRMFRGFVKESSTMTTESCLKTCVRGGFVYAGLQIGSWCMCDNTFPHAATNGFLPDSKCATNCSGNGSKKCGGSWTMSVYETGVEQYLFHANGDMIGESHIQASPNRYYALHNENAKILDS